MANAERRVSYPDDGENMIQTTDEDDGMNNLRGLRVRPSIGTPKHHTKCPDCFRSGGPTGFCSHFINRQQVTETEYRTQEAARRVRWGSRDVSQITARRHTIIFKTTQLTGNIGKAIARKGLRSVRR